MTSSNRIFGKRLKQLYKKGKLKTVLQAKFPYSHLIGADAFLGSGDDATAFMCPNGKEVLKLCCKTIGFFSYFPHATGHDFAKLSQKLAPYLLPVSEVLYEDEYVMVYTQPVCEKFNKIELTRDMIIDIFNIEIGLLRQNMWTSASRHNLGVVGNRAVIFDYHDLRPLEVDRKNLEKAPWWPRSFRHLIKFLTFYMDQNLAPQYLDAWDASGLKGLLAIDDKLEVLPLCFIDSMKQIEVERHKGIDLKTFIKLLMDCRKKLDQELPD